MGSNLKHHPLDDAPHGTLARFRRDRRQDNDDACVRLARAGPLVALSRDQQLEAARYHLPQFFSVSARAAPANDFHADRVILRHPARARPSDAEAPLIEEREMLVEQRREFQSAPR
jgi:hypothetical protein